MSKLKNTLEQSRKMAVLFQRRTVLRDELAALDEEIMAVENGEPAVKEQYETRARPVKGDLE